MKGWSNNQITYYFFHSELYIIFIYFDNKPDIISLFTILNEHSQTYLFYDIHI